MQSLPFSLRFLLVALFCGVGIALASAVQTVVPFAHPYVPMIGFAVLALVALVVFPEIRSFRRSGAALSTWLAASALFLLAPMVGLAQDGTGIPLGDIGIDITGIFTSTASLAIFAVTLVQYLRAHVWKTLDGGTLIGVVFGVCLVLAVVGFFAGLIPSATSIYAAVGFGVGAGVTAIGGVNLLQKAGAKGNPTITQ